MDITRFLYLPRFILYSPRLLDNPLVVPAAGCDHMWQRNEGDSTKIVLVSLLVVGGTEGRLLTDFAKSDYCLVKRERC